MSRFLSEAEFSREAAILLKRLSRTGGILRNTSNHLSRNKNWTITTSRKNSGRTETRTNAHVVERLLALGWIENDGSGNFRVSAKGRLKLKQTATPEPDFVDQHQLRERTVVKLPDEPQTQVVVNVTESPIGWLRNRKDTNGKPFLQHYHFEAAERLRADFERAQMTASITSSWDFSQSQDKHSRAVNAADGLTTNERAIAAKQRFFGAIDTLNTESGEILMRVCCLADGLEAAERYLGWPKRSGKFLLRMALEQLSEHYGLKGTPSRHARSGSIRSWGSEGYRPGMHMQPTSDP